MKMWLTLVLCIALTVAKTQCAAVFTTDTLVVAKTDNEDSPTPSPSDPVTEEPDLPIMLTEMIVRSEVRIRYAHTTFITHVKNPAPKAQEATFHVLLPDTALISGFVMTLGGKSYKAYIKEKNEAEKDFNDAVSRATGAAHNTAKARNSNHFTVSVNVEPNSVAIFNLTYEEMLVRRNGVYNHVINLHPGTLVPKLEVVVHIKESQKITTLRVPEVRTGNEIDATDNDGQNSKAVLTRNGDKEATITFTPDIEEQMRLNKIYKDKKRDSASHGYNSWPELEQQENLGLLGQFAVQYDVERSNYGEILVNDSYFVQFLADDSPILSKHVVFVLDTSSSMSLKIDQLKVKMYDALSNLNPYDYFNIVQINSNYSVHQLKEADEEAPNSTEVYSMQYNKKLVSPAIASPENTAKASTIIFRLLANGLTNMCSGLNVAIDLIQKFANDTKAEKSINKTNSPDNAPELEPIIIVLTDGDPTMSETEKSCIADMVTEKLSGKTEELFIFSLFDVAGNSLSIMSLEDFMRHIYGAADGVQQQEDFYRQVSSPLQAHVKFTYPQEQVKEGTVSKNQFRMVYAGSEIVVAGELADHTSELAPIINVFRGDKEGTRRPYEIRSKIPVIRAKEDLFPVERLWAYLNIKQLLDQRDAAEQLDEDLEKKALALALKRPYEIRSKIPVIRAKEDLFPVERLWAYLNIKQLLDQRDAAEQLDEDLEKKALALALKYSFVTSLTSLVIVKPNGTSVVGAESDDKNVPGVATTTQLWVTTEVPDEKKYHILEHYS